MAADTTGQWRRHVVSLTNGSFAGNPFEVEVEATFTHTASGNQITLPGYYAGADAWRIGFMPTMTGEWTWITSSGDPDLDDQTGSVDAVFSASRGMLTSDATHPRKWKYSENAGTDLGCSKFGPPVSDFEAPQLHSAKQGGRHSTGPPCAVSITRSR
ncbi:MAG: DUF5060 domain-containing protein [Thermoanaerobaculia bacterium]